MIRIYYNALADNGNILSSLTPIKERLEKKWGVSIETKNSNDLVWAEEIASFSKEDKILLAGGDGTLNYFINSCDPSHLEANIYLLPLGTGNDFLNDQKEKENEDGLVPLNDCLSSLPYIEVNGLKRRFINGIGYGIDGDCCVVAERMKKEGKKEIDYSKITISLLFKGFKPRNAKVKVDGKEYSFKKVYLASSMLGKYYGGGMMIAPSQDRHSGLLSFVTIYGRGKLGTLMMFPKIFFGKHVNDRKHAFVMSGKEIEVSFDKQCGLQIDGEVVENVLTYKVHF